MELNFSFGGVNCILGMKWVRLSSSKIASEARQEAKIHGSKAGVKRRIKDEDGERHQVGFSSSTSSKGLVSAAALLAEISDNAVVVQSINKDKFWVCATANKEVLPGYDQVLNREDAIPYANEAISLMAEEGIDYELIIDSKSNDLLGSLSDHPQGFADFLSESEIPSSVMRSAKVSGIGNNAVIYLVATGVIAGGAFVYYSKNQITAIENPGVPLIAPAKPKTPISQILAEAKTEEMGWVAKELSSEDAISAVRLTGEYFMSLPSSISGWKVDEINWEKGSDLIRTVWRKTPGTTPLMLQEATGRDRIIFTKGSTIANMIDPLIIKKISVTPDDLPELLENKKYDLIHLNHELSILGVSFGVEENKNFKKRPEPIKRLGKDPNATLRQYKIKATDIFLRGEGISDYNEAGSALGKLSGFIPSNIKITATQNLEWEINGVIYAH